MMRWVRRLFWLGLLAAAGYCAYKAIVRGQSQPGDVPQWSPLPTDGVPNVPTDPADTVQPTSRRTATQRWVTVTNGTCPDGYPIKANESSGIFHVPGGRFYARTTADRCYASAEDAVADGYRPAKA